jgi:hypothetical protein
MVKLIKWWNAALTPEWKEVCWQFPYMEQENGDNCLSTQTLDEEALGMYKLSFIHFCPWRLLSSGMSHHADRYRYFGWTYYYHLIYHEDGGSRFLWYLGTYLPNNMVSDHRSSSLHSHCYENLKIHVLNLVNTLNCKVWLLSAPSILHISFRSWMHNCVGKDSEKKEEGRGEGNNE